MLPESCRAVNESDSVALYEIRLREALRGRESHIRRSVYDC